MTSTTNKTKERNGRRIFIPIVIIGALLLALVSYLLVSHRYPSWGYSIQGFKDKTTHYYQKDKPFRYENFEFTFNSSTKDVGTKQDCPAKAKLEADDRANEFEQGQKFFLYFCSVKESKQKCWQDTYDGVLALCNIDNKDVDENELVDIQIDVKNMANTMRGLSKDWFKIEIDGKTLDNNSKVNYYFKDNIGPNETSSNAFNFKIAKTPSVTQRIIITLPGKASQIIQIQ